MAHFFECPIFPGTGRLEGGVGVGVFAADAEARCLNEGELSPWVSLSMGARSAVCLKAFDTSLVPHCPLQLPHTTSHRAALG